MILTKCADEDRRKLLTPLVCLGLPVLWHQSATIWIRPIAGVTS